MWCLFSADPHKSFWPDITVTRLTSLIVCVSEWRHGLSTYLTVHHANLEQLAFSPPLSFSAGTDKRVGRAEPVQDSPGERQQGECRGDSQGKLPHLRNCLFPVCHHKNKSQTRENAVWMRITEWPLKFTEGAETELFKFKQAEQKINITKG